MEEIVGDQCTFPWGESAAWLTNGAGYVRFEQNRAAPYAESQRLAIQRLAGDKHITLHRWWNDPTPESTPPREQHEFVRVCRRMQTLGIPTLLVASFKHFCSDAERRSVLFAIAAGFEVFVTSPDGDSYGQYVRSLEAQTIARMKKRALMLELNTHTVQASTTAIGYRINEDGKIVQDEQQLRMLERIRHFREDGVRIEDLGLVLAKEGFVNAEGKPWSRRKLAAISARVAPLGSGRGNRSKRRLHPRMSNKR